MNVKHKISIITINYNNCEGLIKTIKSVINQTFHDIEYIIIDGGSKDGSVDIIQEYADKIDYWISERDKGIYHAMNKGAAAAHGEYTLFLNSGDELCNPYVINQAIPSSWTADFVSGNVITDKSNKLTSPYEVTMEYFIKGSLPHPSTFIRRSLFDLRAYDERYKISGDWDFFLYHLIKNNSSYQHIDIDVSLFDTSGISSTTTINKDDEDLKRNAIESILPPRVRADYKLFMGETDSFHCLFYTISQSKNKKYVYWIVLVLLKVFMFNRGWIKNFPLSKT